MMKNTVPYRIIFVVLLLFSSLPLGVFISLSILENLQNSEHAVNTPLAVQEQDIMTKIEADLKANWKEIEEVLVEHFSEEELLYIIDFWSSSAQYTLDTVVEFLQQQDKELVQVVSASAGSFLLMLLLFAIYKKVGNPFRGRLHQDRLTKLLNHDWLIKELKSRIGLYKCIKEPFCILIVAIDNLKQINEAYGQDKEDQILKSFASMAKKTVRDDDIVFRYSDDTFVILLKFAKTEEAYNLAERLRTKMEVFDFQLKERVTISIGISEFFEEKDMDKLLADANDALHQAKAQGCNQSCIH